MSAGGVAFLAAGTAVGALQAWLLARQARRRGSPTGGVARLLLVGATLVAAARAGHLAAAAIGWLGGVLANGARERRRLP